EALLRRHPGLDQAASRNPEEPARLARPDQPPPHAPHQPGAPARRREGRQGAREGLQRPDHRRGIGRLMEAVVSRGRGFLAGVLIGILSLLCAVAGTLATATLAEQFNWCCVHGWALMHGSGVVVLMAWGLVGFHLVVFLAVRLRLSAPRGQFGALAHIAYISTALGSLWIT